MCIDVKMLFTKQYSDDDFQKMGQGNTFDVDHYDTIVDTPNAKGYYIDAVSGKKKVLFKLLKNKFNEKTQNVATKSFKELAMRKQYNRGMAAGKPKGAKTARHMLNGQSMAINFARSNIAGYYDIPDRRHKYAFKTEVACRKTAFTKNNIHMWEDGVPFIQKCSALYKAHGGAYYKEQAKEYDIVQNEIKIPNTVFTTVTVNYNWRTACHKDTGDFSRGLGNLAVTGRDFSGCYLGFPQFKVCIKVEPGDFLLMDVHQWHCNTEMHLTKPDGFRISYVSYLRNNMSKCSKKRIVDNELYYV